MLQDIVESALQVSRQRAEKLCPDIRVRMKGDKVKGRFHAVGKIYLWIKGTDVAKAEIIESATNCVFSNHRRSSSRWCLLWHG
jgi:hypothetical protein